MNDDRLLDEALRELRELPAPDAPRERMWAHIEAARGNRRAGGREGGRVTAFPTARWRWARVGTALAAMLVLGFAVGRWTGDPAPVADDGASSTAARLADRRADGYRRAATLLYDRAEVLLAGFQVEAGRSDATRARDATADWAAGLLAQSRLLLDSPAADDPDTRRLLRELELVLARIAALPPADDSGEAARIADDITERATLQRLRLAGAL